MQLLFVIFFGLIVSFILYLSYHTHVIESKEKNDDMLINKENIIETENNSNEEIVEKVLDNNIVSDDNINVESVKFKARRNNKNIVEEDEEII